MVDRMNSWYTAALLTARNGFKREEGQAVAEYALILALVAVAAVAVLMTLGDEISDKISSISNSISGAGATTTTP